jgi:hypothetical protein
MASLLSAAREEKSAKVMNVSLHVYLIYRRVSAPYITIHQNHPLRFTPRNPTRQKLTDLRPQDPPPWPIWIFAGNDKNQIETTKKSNARRFPNSKAQIGKYAFSALGKFRLWNSQKLHNQIKIRDRKLIRKFLGMKIERFCHKWVSRKANLLTGSREILVFTYVKWCSFVELFGEVRWMQM